MARAAKKASKPVLSEAAKALMDEASAFNYQRKAAMAWAPPTASTRSAPPMAAAAKVMGPGRGLATTTSRTPAARAVTAVINTLLGKGKRPPGA